VASRAAATVAQLDGPAAATTHGSPEDQDNETPRYG
jgi:hypothetical protein